MRVIEPRQFYSIKKPKAPKKRLLRISIIVIVSILIAVSGLAIWSYNLPLPNVSAKTITVSSQGEKVSLPWPNYGQAAIGAVGYGLLESTPDQKVVPTASVAKIMTALAVLNAKPIELNQQGQTITFTSSDEKLFSDYLAKNGTVVLVKAGEQLTEYQALQAMLLPSANNIADSLAIWAFGSAQKYSDYANKLAQNYGLTNTTITSASGYPPQTVSTANDLVKLGILAMKNQVIKQIVAQKTANIPVAGKINNVNGNLGYHGIIGIKTGNTDQAGGCFLYAADHTFANGQTITLVGAILGGPNLVKAMLDSFKLIDTSFENFENRTIVKQGDKLGYYDLPWGGQVIATADKDVSVWVWKGSNIISNVKLKDINSSSKAGNVVGSFQNGNQSTNILLSSDIVLPNQAWRLKRWI